MADTNQSNVDLRVNGAQASAELDKARKKVEEFEKAWRKAAEAGDKALMGTIKKGLVEAKRELRQMESGTKAVERVFLQLNKATPNDLNKALKFLQNELKNIERGSVAWKQHTEQIKVLKAELDKVNSELRQSEGLFTRMKNTVNSWGASIAAGAAAMTGVVAACKAAVQAYAEMQQEEANVRKYTGMTAEQVEHLNEAFKNMDTRTSREGLNQLAQEAGRLGKQSEDDVLGFVKAADKINVALDELGDGATLTLSKLTTIFGDEARMGTEKSLLAVGSVINELSQNSTAAAPYLAEFGQRMAGVGAQAHMTIPEIMGFGAVLDSQGQKLEMSATALSKVIMNLFKNPAKIAQATGLAVEEFSETCKRSTNEGLLMLLDRLHELGGIDALAPVFKDMGENGARASAVLAALAGNVDTVRQQQEAANIAFAEANSIDKEFEVQNTTVMAGFEKRKKIFREHAVELGEKLLPVMGYFHTSMSYTMKALSMTVDWVIKYREVLAGAIVSIATYFAIVKAKEAWDSFTGGVKKAIEAVKAFNAALKANPYAAIIAVLAGLGTAFAMVIKKNHELSLAQKTLNDASKQISDQYTKERAKVEMLNDAVHDETLSLNARREALQKLQQLVPDYHASLTEEGKLMNDNVEAVEKYVNALEQKIRMQVYEEKLEELYRKKMQAEQNVEDRSTDLDKAQKKAEEHAGDVQINTSMGAAGPTGGHENVYMVDVQLKTGNLDAAKKELNEVGDAIDAIKKKMGGDAILSAGTQSSGGLVGNKPSETVTGGTTGGGGGVVPDLKTVKKEHDAALKEIDDWKKKEQAIEDVAYSTGQKSFSEHVEENKRIEKEYHEKRLALMQEGTSEYWQEQASYEKKLRADSYAESLKDQQAFYEDEKRCLDDRYMSNELTHKQYTRALEEAEVDHLASVVRIYKEGSEEYIKAQEALQKKEHDIQKKRSDEYKKIQDEIKKAYFSTTSGASDTEAYEEEMMQLEAVKNQLLLMAETEEQKNKIFRAYREARFQIAKKYNMDEAMDTENSFRSAMERFNKWLESEEGQAVTRSFSTMVSGMGEIFSGLTSLVDAETDLQTAKINKKYEAEIAAAGNNKDAVARLEAEKEKEIADVKNEAEEKKYSMQIASAIAQTAISALNAYSSAASIPAVGWIMAPIAAALAITAGGIQIATLKKQHEAAMAQGYAAGGYTMPGSKFQPAGIVHAGEWVASQELLANPTAAATIAQLDQAQRTNTIGQLSKPAPQISAGSSASEASAGSSAGSSGSSSGDTAVSDSINRLNKHLDNGIYAATLLTGDKGLLRAQKRHNQLLKNKGK